MVSPGRNPSILESSGVLSEASTKTSACPPPLDSTGWPAGKYTAGAGSSFDASVMTRFAASTRSIAP
jgi:hypothetical protein